MVRVSATYSKAKREAKRYKGPTIAKQESKAVKKGTLPRTQQLRIARRKARRFRARAKKKLTYDIRQKGVISMRGRRHVMEQQPFDQPLSPQDEYAASTAIYSYKYSEDLQMLEITFVKGGTYRYFGVTLEVVKGFGVAASKGRYFHRMIRGAYKFRRIR